MCHLVAVYIHRGDGSSGAALRDCRPLWDHQIDGPAGRSNVTAMTIELKPEQERILQEALRQGRFHSVEEALDRALQSIAPQGGSPKRTTRPPGRKSLAQWF